MRCLRLTNVQHTENCFAWDNYAHSVFIVELPKWLNSTTHKEKLYLRLSVFFSFVALTSHF